MSVHFHTPNMIITTDPIYDHKTYKLVTRDTLWEFMQSSIEGETEGFSTIKDWLWYIFDAAKDIDDEGNTDEPVLTEDDEIEMNLQDLLGQDGNKPVGFFVQCQEGIMNCFGEIVTENYTLHAIAITRKDGRSIIKYVDPKYNTADGEGRINEDDDDPADRWKNP